MPEGRMMYEACPICDQSHRVLTQNRGWIDCPACQPLRVVPVGVTVEQLERLRIDPHAELIESTANMLRGMTLDPAIPSHAKEAMMERLKELESVHLY